MDANYWHQRWKTNGVAFHQGKVNPLLESHIMALSVANNARVFVPLCGKTLDIAWLLSRSLRVAGVELSELAVKQLFEELGIKPVITQVGELKCYAAKDIDIFVGDIFGLTRTMLGPVNAVFDRAAFVALPADMRNRYTRHVNKITDNVSQLLITYEYDQELMAGPPFSVSDKVLHRHYIGSYEISLLASVDVAGRLKGICAAKEKIWLLEQSDKQ